MRRSDDSLSLALCASLIVHVAILFAAYETRVYELSSELHQPGWSASQREQLAMAATGADTPSPPLIQPAPDGRLPPKPREPDNSEWGEQNGKGVAINSAPGDKPLSAPKGPEDQSFGSRDPAGPATQFPEEPSMSTVPPGQNGDGRTLIRDALAGRGTEGNPAILPAQAAYAPPPTVAQRPPIDVADSRTGSTPSQAAASDRSGSAVPGGDDLLSAAGDDTPQAPTIVPALTSPPGAADSNGPARTLPDIVSASSPGSPEVQEAVRPMNTPEPVTDLALPPDQQTTLAVAPEVKPTATTAPNPLTLDPLATATRAPVALVPKAPAGSAASATGGIPGPAVPAADPAADTGLESDPFSTLPGVEFRNGKVDARSGRQVKPVRPRLSEAGRRDLLSRQFPTILLKVRIDNTGKVQDVRVLRGSGSEAVDMPVYRAMWQWWFEPPKDKTTGRPLPDVQLVAIHWS